MNKQILNRKSKFLSLVLRHQPHLIDLNLDEQGWTNIDELLIKAKEKAFVHIDREELAFIVENNNKKRFAINEAGTHIRASQGHSIPIDLGYEAQIPPEELYHGTVEKFLPSIQQKGLIKGNRHHVHLSADIETARQVAMRRGKAIILQVKSSEMHRAGYRFYISQNGVWLTEEVPPAFLALSKYI